MFESFNRILRGDEATRSEERLPRPTPDDITEMAEGEFRELRERNSDTYRGEVRRVARYGSGDTDQTTSVTYPGWEQGDFRKLLEELAVRDPDVLSLIPPEKGEVREAA